MGQIEPDRKAKIQATDIEALQARAKEIGRMGAPNKKELVILQAKAVYALALDFWELGILGQDFPRWLALHSEMPRSTCRRRLDQGREINRREEEGQQLNRNGSGLLAEYRERKLTPRPELEVWED